MPKDKQGREAKKPKKSKSVKQAAAPRPVLPPAPRP